MTRRLDDIPPLFVYRVVVAVRSFMARVLRWMVPPRVALFEQFTGMWLTQMIYTAAKLELADALANGPLSAKDLAVRAHADPDAVARLMRALVSVGIFERTRDGRFALNRWAEPLRSDRADSMRDIVIFLGSPHSMAGWARFSDAVANGKNGFEQAHGKPFFDYLTEHPDDAAVFHGGMASMTELDAPSLVRGYDYSKFETICDVAGGRGTLLAALLSVYPRLRGTLLDLPQATLGCADVFREWGVTERSTVVEGNFFEAIPEGHDAYVLKEIIHDWDDPRAEAILRVCRRAMRPGATLLVMEMVVLDDDRAHPGKLLDMEMLDMTQEGRQRTADEHRALLERTGFRFCRVVSLPGASSIVEAIAIA